MTSVLVTGAAGFLGTHIVSGLVRAGHRVRAVDRFQPAGDQEAEVSLKADVVVGSLTERDVVERAVSDVDVVVHLACTTVPQSSEDQRVYDVHSNVETTLLLLECAVAAGVKRFVFASSGGTVYGRPRSLPIAEDHPTEPICSHGVMKLTIENYLRVFCRLSGIETIALRMSNPYGRGQGIKPQGFIGVLVRRIDEGRAVDLWGDGRVVRDFVHVSDVAAAFERVVAGCGRPGAYNIGSSQGRTLLEVVGEIERIMGRQIPMKRAPGRPIDVDVNVLDISKARRELGWTPKVSLEAGLRDLLEVK